MTGSDNGNIHDIDLTDIETEQRTCPFHTINIGLTLVKTPYILNSRLAILISVWIMEVYQYIMTLP